MLAFLYVKANSKEMICEDISFPSFFQKNAADVNVFVGWDSTNHLEKNGWLPQFFFSIFIYTVKVVTNTVHNSTYIHLLTIRHVTEFTFITCMQSYIAYLQHTTLLTCKHHLYDTNCLHYITRYYITIHYITCLHISLTIHDIT